MTSIDSIILCVEESSLKNLTAWDYLMRMCTLLGSPLLSQVLVELKFSGHSTSTMCIQDAESLIFKMVYVYEVLLEHMQTVEDRNPILLATQTETADPSIYRVSFMEALMSEWRINRRVRQLTGMLQREIIKRQSEDKPVPGCPKSLISQDFPSLCSKTQAKTVPIYILCDHILNKYDLFMDKKYRELHRDVQLELSSPENKEVHNDVTSCTPNRNTNCGSKASNSLPVEAGWFCQYQRSSSPKADTRAGAKSDTDRKIKKHKKSSSKTTMDKHGRPKVKTTTSAKRTADQVKRRIPAGIPGCTSKKDTHTRPIRQQAMGTMKKTDAASSCITEDARKEMAKKKRMQYEAQRALYDKIFMAAAIPKSALNTVNQSVDAQSSKNNTNVQERNRQAVMAHIARFRIKKINRASEVEPAVVKDGSHKRKTVDSSLNDQVKTKCAKISAGSDLKTKTGKSLKRKASDVPSLGTSQHSKYAKLDTGSAVKAFDGHVIERQH